MSKEKNKPVRLGYLFSHGTSSKRGRVVERRLGVATEGETFTLLSVSDEALEAAREAWAEAKESAGPIRDIEVLISFKVRK